MMGGRVRMPTASCTPLLTPHSQPQSQLLWWQLSRPEYGGDRKRFISLCPLPRTTIFEGCALSTRPQAFAVCTRRVQPELELDRAARLMARPGACKQSIRWGSSKSTTTTSAISNANAQEIPLKSSASSTTTTTTPPAETPESKPLSGDTSSSSSTATPSGQSTFHDLFDRALARVNVISHHMNVYMGTDYSGITALRERIAGQEKAVAEAYKGMTAAKTAHNEALATQSTRQKEVVQLLERKNSWSAGDLERYMALIRREHAEEQAVNETAEALAGAERDLEACRVALEKIERRQYHAEQIWSDTIRRNSTWVTIGLMGFNVVLLLVSVVVFEPWRRRRIVREVKHALAESESSLLSRASPPLPATPTPSPVPTMVETGEIEAAIDAATPPEHISQETLEAEPEPEHGSLSSAALPWAWPAARIPDQLRSWTNSLFSEAAVSMRRRDLTLAVLEGVGAGAAATAVLAWAIVLRSSGARP